MEADAAAVWALWRACAEDPRSCWNDAYPTLAFLRGDLENGWLYVLGEPQRLIGSVTLMETDDLEKLGFPFMVRDSIAVITRLCVQPELQRKGYGAQLLSLAEQRAATLGARAVHLLCDVRNQPALALYRHAGYRRVCDARLYGDHFWVCEKLLKPHLGL